MLINETAPLFSATQHRSNHVSLFIIIHYLILPKEERVVPKGQACTRVLPRRHTYNYTHKCYLNYKTKQKKHTKHSTKIQKTTSTHIHIPKQVYYTNPVVCFLLAASWVDQSFSVARAISLHRLGDQLCWLCGAGYQPALKYVGNALLTTKSTLTVQ